MCCCRDLTDALHQEERLAWQRLFQILHHEMNNSLAPISSIAESLTSLVSAGRPIEEMKDNLRQGLSIIAVRSDALHRFIEAYSKVTHLPEPRLGPVRVSRAGSARAWVGDANESDDASRSPM